MYNGSFTACILELDTDPQRKWTGEGKVVNGLIDGRVEMKHYNCIIDVNTEEIDFIDVISSYSIFNMGKIESEYRTFDNGERIAINDIFEDGVIRQYWEGDAPSDSYYLKLTGGLYGVSFVHTQPIEDSNGVVSIYPY